MSGTVRSRADARRPTLILALCIVLHSCSVTTSPELEEFEFTDLEQSQTIEESVDARAFAGEILFVGQFRTPHACFELRPALEKADGSVTLRIGAQSRNDQCPTPVGAYRYSGVIRRLEPGSYDFHIVHVVPGQSNRTHTFDLIVR